MNYTSQHAPELRRPGGSSEDYNSRHAAPLRPHYAPSGPGEGLSGAGGRGGRGGRRSRFDGRSGGGGGGGGWRRWCSSSLSSTVARSSSSRCTSYPCLRRAEAGRARRPGDGAEAGPGRCAGARAARPGPGPGPGRRAGREDGPAGKARREARSSRRPRPRAPAPPRAAGRRASLAGPRGALGSRASGRDVPPLVAVGDSPRRPCGAGALAAGPRLGLGHRAGPARARDRSSPLRGTVRGTVRGRVHLCPCRSGARAEDLLLCSSSDWGPGPHVRFGPAPCSRGATSLRRRPVHPPVQVVNVGNKHAELHCFSFLGIPS